MRPGSYLGGAVVIQGNDVYVSGEKLERPIEQIVELFLAVHGRTGEKEYFNHPGLRCAISVRGTGVVSGSVDLD